MAFVQASSRVDFAFSTTPTVSLTGVTVGNLLVVGCFFTANASQTQSPTSGWSTADTPADAGSGTSNFVGIGIFYKTATATSESFTDTLTNASSTGSIIMLEFSGYASPVTLNVAAVDGNAGAVSSLSVGPTATTTLPNTLALYLFGLVENDAGTTTLGISAPTTGTTNAMVVNDNANLKGGRFDWKERTSTGTESATWTFTPANASLDWATGNIVILSGAATGSPPPYLFTPMRPRTASGGMLIKTPLAYILPASSNSLSFVLPGVTGTGSAGNVSAFVSSTVPPPLPPRLGSPTGLGGLMPQVFLQNPPPQFTNVTVTLTGVTGTGSAGTVTAFVSSTVPPLQPPAIGPATGLGGVLPTIKLAYPVPASILSANVTVSLAGVTGTGSVGTLTAFVSSTVPPMLPPQLGPATGRGGIMPTLKLAYVQPEFTNLYLTLAGVTGTGSVGTITVAVDMPLPSVTGTGSAGTITAAIATSALASTTGTGSAGLIAATVSSALGGVSASSSVGTISPAIATFLLAVTGTGSAGTITSSGGTPVNNPYHSVAFFSSVAGYNSVSFFQSVAQFNSEAQP